MDLDEVMGMLLYRKVTPIRHNVAVAWITTKPAYQKNGIASALLKQAGIVGTFRTIERNGSRQQVPATEVDCAFLLPQVTKPAEKLGYLLRFRPYLPDVELWDELIRERR